MLQENSEFILIFTECINLFGVLRRFQHCTGHIMMGSWKGRGNQYIQLVKVLYCKLPTNVKQLPAFPLEAMPGTKPRPQRWEARVLPPGTVAPLNALKDQCNHFYILIKHQTYISMRVFLTQRTQNDITQLAQFFYKPVYLVISAFSPSIIVKRSGYSRNALRHNIAHLRFVY